MAAEHHEPFDSGQVSSGVKELDFLLGGGLGRGTSALLLGPAGSGKSAIATQYAVSAAGRGEAAAIFTFDEGLDVLQRRAHSTGMDLRSHVASGRISLQQIDPAELSPGEFAHVVRSTVEQHGVKVLIIDSLNGYLQSMPEEHFLTLQLHELLSYLRQRGVLTIMTMAQHGLLGHMDNPVDVSYLADAVVLTRYFEAGGRVRKAVSALKQRSAAHEDTIREFTLSADGLKVGPPLADFHGVLTGVPELRQAARESA